MAVSPPLKVPYIFCSSLARLMHIENCSIVPLNSEHAVRSVSFVCELGANLSPEKIKEIISYYDNSTELRKIFPKKTAAQGASIYFSQHGVDVNNSGDINQVILERIGTDGSTEFGLSLQGNIINFNSNQYSRWASVSQEAFAILSQFVSLVLPAPGISVFGLQYVDEFIVTGEINSFRPSMLFEPGSKILPANVSERTGPWHNHTGWFSDDNTEQHDKLLHNLNINVIPQHEKVIVQIIGAHRYILSNPIANIDDDCTVMTNKFQIMHDVNKALLRELLSKQALEEIHLGG